MVTKDKEYTFVFYEEGDNLICDVEGSASCMLDDGTKLPHGAVFVKKPIEI